MCTDICPCYTDYKAKYETIDGKRKRVDTYGKYMEMPLGFLKMYGRVFFEKDAKKGNVEYLPFRWSNDKN